MVEFVTSRDGTRIALERRGDGPRTLVVVGGMFCDRARMLPLVAQLAEELAGRWTVVGYDRRGRGDSGDTAPYAVEREVDDLRALVDAAPGAMALYGHSSGAGLALLAVAAGVPVTHLVLHEPPYGGDDDASTDAARALAVAVGAAIAAGRPGDAIRTFMADTGMPPEVVDGMATDPGMLALAPTMPYDLAVMGDDDGGTVPEDLVRAIAVPTLVMAGGTGPDFFRATADHVVALLPDGELAVLAGHDHDAPPQVVAPVVAEFLTRRG